MKNITVEELKAKMDAEKGVHLIDVREPHEYAEVNIGAQLIPLSCIQNMQIESIEHLKDEEIFLHCRSGVRSVTAALLLEMQGFKNVINVTGGIQSWMEKFGK